MKFIFFFILISSSTAILIDCQFNFNYLPSLGSVYTCIVKSMDFSLNSTHIENFNGSHIGHNSNMDVLAIIFPVIFCPDFNLTTIPKGFLMFFPNFVAFNFEGCGIENLNGDKLEEYPYLEHFWLSDSNLERIPGNFFSHNQKLKFINFSNNKIVKVGEGLIDNLVALEQAWFNSNVCIDMMATTPFEFTDLIESLRVNCINWISTTSTTFLSTTNLFSTTFKPENCEIENIEKFLCEIDEKIESLKIIDEILWTEIQELKYKNLNLTLKVENLEEINEKFKNEILNLTVKNENLELKVEKLEDEFEELKIEKENLENFVRNLEENVQNLNIENQELRNNLESQNFELQSHAEKLNALEVKVLELTSRPCSC